MFVKVNFIIFFSFLVIFRQIVARTILETLRVVTDDAADVDAVLNVMNKLADDVGKFKLTLQIKPTMKNAKLSHQRFGPKSGPNQELGFP